jgi:hypothetical protein
MDKSNFGSNPQQIVPGTAINGHWRGEPGLTSDQHVVQSVHCPRLMSQKRGRTDMLAADEDHIGWHRIYGYH